MNKRLLIEYFDIMVDSFESTYNYPESLPNIKENLKEGVACLERQIKRGNVNGTTEEVEALEKIAKMAYRKLKEKDSFPGKKYDPNWGESLAVKINSVPKRLVWAYKKYIEQHEELANDIITPISSEDYKRGGSVNETLLKEFISLIAEDYEDDTFDGEEWLITIKNNMNDWCDFLKEEIKEGNIAGTKSDVKALRTITTAAYEKLQRSDSKYTTAPDGNNAYCVKEKDVIKRLKGALKKYLVKQEEKLMNETAIDSSREDKVVVSPIEKVFVEEKTLVGEGLGYLNGGIYWHEERPSLDYATVREYIYDGLGRFKGFLIDNAIDSSMQKKCEESLRKIAATALVNLRHKGTSEPIEVKDIELCINKAYEQYLKETDEKQRVFKEFQERLEAEDDIKIDEEEMEI